MNLKLSRRDLLRQGATFIALGIAAPGWLARLASADIQTRSKGRRLPDDRILVVVQLSGGNDGLNTIIPYTEPRYRQLRPTLAIPENQVVPLDEHIGLHPSFAKVKPLVEAGQFAVIQGVGYPNPNRSHFRSMEIWQTANPDKVVGTGWLGRYLDTLPDSARNPLIGITLGRENPVAMTGQQVSVPCVASLEDFKSLAGEEAEALHAVYALQDSKTASVRAATLKALDAAEIIRQRVGQYRSPVEYPRTPFAQALQQIAQLIAAGIGTRVFYCSTGGFDTHAQQARTHAVLLQNVAEGLSAFWTDLQAMGKADKVLVLAFSEFGRRVAENGSAGTDHGAAAPMFAMGKSIYAGLLGEHPSLSDLQDGDLRYHIDFRSVYAAVLEDWLDADSQQVLGGRFDKVSLIRRG
ncbi:MAG: hypothetical protein KatS3mg022_0015 [Armatimonadota bacterium]|nr:MAG: hypothetical protein KatS3mg022_0015 [Armatimonadota bacterium]